MSLLGWIAAGLATAAVAAVVLSVLYADEILNWFQSRISRNSFSSNRVGFTVMKHLNNGNFEVVQGVINTTTKRSWRDAPSKRSRLTRSCETLTTTAVLPSGIRRTAQEFPAGREVILCRSDKQETES